MVQNSDDKDVPIEERWKGIPNAESNSNAWKLYSGRHNRDRDGELGSRGPNSPRDAGGRTDRQLGTHLRPAQRDADRSAADLFPERKGEPASASGLTRADVGSITARLRTTRGNTVSCSTAGTPALPAA